MSCGASQAQQCEVPADGSNWADLAGSSSIQAYP